MAFIKKVGKNSCHFLHALSLSCGASEFQLCSWLPVQGNNALHIFPSPAESLHCDLRKEWARGMISIVEFLKDSDNQLLGSWRKNVNFNGVQDEGTCIMVWMEIVCRHAVLWRPALCSQLVSSRDQERRTKSVQRGGDAVPGALVISSSSVWFFTIVPRCDDLVGCLETSLLLIKLPLILRMSPHLLVVWMFQEQ